MKRINQQDWRNNVDLLVSWLPFTYFTFVASVLLLRNQFPDHQIHNHRLDITRVATSTLHFDEQTSPPNHVAIPLQMKFFSQNLCFGLAAFCPNSLSVADTGRGLSDTRNIRNLQMPHCSILPSRCSHPICLEDVMNCCGGSTATMGTAARKNNNYRVHPTTKGASSLY